MDEKELIELKEQDAVISLPVNAFKMELIIEVVDDEDGHIQKVSKILKPEDIREAFDLFNKTLDGEYPSYTLTDKAKGVLERINNGTATQEDIDWWEEVRDI